LRQLTDVKSLYSFFALCEKSCLPLMLSIFNLANNNGVNLNALEDGTLAPVIK
jgi:hypothetical protein